MKTNLESFTEGMHRGQLIQLDSLIQETEHRLKFLIKERDRHQRELEEMVIQEAFEPNPEVNEELVKKLQDMIENYPEYSSEHIKCMRWGDYSLLDFEVMDPDDQEKFNDHIVSAESLVPTYEKYGEKIEKHYEESCEFFDMEMVDVFMQYHFYGRVIYG